jgi:hypothetical protein
MPILHLEDVIETLLNEFRRDCSRNGQFVCEEWQLEKAFDSLLFWAEERCQRIADEQETVKGLRAAEACRDVIASQRKEK